MKSPAWIVALLILLSCATKQSKFIRDPEEMVMENRANGFERPNPFFQANPMDFVPDTLHLSHTPRRYLRLNFHFMDAADSTRNFNETQSRKFVRDLLHVMQILFDTNIKLWLPKDNDIPVIPVNLKYELTGTGPEDDGIYHHYDDQLYYYLHMGQRRNNADWSVIEKYAVGLDSILNIFIMPHLPDSVKSVTYKSGCVGIALGNAIKIAGIYENKLTEWNVRGTFNHEIGHVLGLYHAWTDDGCPDTQEHPNDCWVIEQAGCAGRTSNNMMDYNAWQSALSPCQVGTIHNNLSNIQNPVRKLLKKTWCTYLPENKIFIKDTINWRGARDLESDIEILPGGYLTIQGRVSMPAGSKILVHPGATLILGDCLLHNDCGQAWNGIEVLRKSKKQGLVVNAGKVEMRNLVR